MIANREYVIKQLAALITEPKKKYSQNFLIDHDIVKKTIDALEEIPFDEVIEIGPGLGALSEEILDRGFQLNAYEIDEIMCHHLSQTFKRRDNFKLIEGDVLKQNFEEYRNKSVSVISNLPYNLTTPIIEKVLLSHINLSSFIFMVQKEVSSRIFAKINSKEYAPLAIFLNYLGEVKPLIKVTRDKFIPAPNVDSLIIRLVIKTERNYNYEEKLYHLLNQCFLMRRKTILNNLTNYFKSKEKAQCILKCANIDCSLRPEQLTLENYQEILKFALENK